MLLVAQVDVVEQRTFSRKKSAGKLKRLGVPILALFLLGGRVEGGVFLHLNDEADFS